MDIIKSDKYISINKLCNLDLIYLHKDKLISDNYTTELMIKCYNGSVTIDYINNNIKDICKVDIDGMTALMYLCDSGNATPELIEALRDEIDIKYFNYNILRYKNYNNTILKNILDYIMSFETYYEKAKCNNLDEIYIEDNLINLKKQNNYIYISGNIKYGVTPLIILCINAIKYKSENLYSCIKKLRSNIGCFECYYGETALMNLNCNKCDLVECVKLLKKEISHKNIYMYGALYNLAINFEPSIEMEQVINLMKNELFFYNTKNKNTTLYALLFNNHISITKYNKIIDKYL